MNKNIKKINSHLWLVNFEYIKAGYIEELKNVKLMNDRTTVTVEGVLLINRTAELADYADHLATWWKYLMTLKDKQLRKNEAYKAYLRRYHKVNTHKWNDDILKMHIKAKNHEAISDFLNKASITELQRRQIVKDYTRIERK